MPFYKATTPEGRSFRDNSTAWAVGEVTSHPSDSPMVPNDAATYLSASTEKADCTGFSWPCRLFEVEPVGEVLEGLDYPYKRAAKAFRVVRELDAFEALGPNGEAMAAFIERCKRLTADEALRLAAAWAAAWDAARYAAGALLVKDKITPEQFDILTKLWRDAGLELPELTSKAAAK
jgi:hypothetical protein